VGRPFKIKPDEFAKVMEKYLKRCEQKDIPITVSGFCAFADISDETLRSYEKNDDYKDVVRRFRRKAEADLIERALMGKVNSTFAIFFAKSKLGWRDHDADPKKPKEININFVKKKDG